MNAGIKGDATPILRSISKAAKILNIEITERDIPSSDGPQYFDRLRNLNRELWAKVYAQNSKAKSRLIL